MLKLFRGGAEFVLGKGKGNKKIRDSGGWWEVGDAALETQGTDVQMNRSLLPLCVLGSAEVTAMSWHCWLILFFLIFPALGSYLWVIITLRYLQSQPLPMRDLLKHCPA